MFAFAETNNIATLEAELQKVQTQLENERHHWGNERHHWGFDLSESRSQTQVLLKERIQPLLEDAVDAMEIDEPAVALRRVKSALKVIAENLM